MTSSYNISEAKAHFSEIIERVIRGEEIQLCRRNVPVAVIKPAEVKVAKKREFGQYEGVFSVPDSFFEPMSEEEVALWYDAPLYNPPDA